MTIPEVLAHTHRLFAVASQESLATFTSGPGSLLDMSLQELLVCILFVQIREVDHPQAQADGQGLFLPDPSNAYDRVCPF